MAIHFVDGDMFATRKLNMDDEELDCGTCPQPYTCIQPQGWCKYVPESP